MSRQNITSNQENNNKASVVVVQQQQQQQQQQDYPDDDIFATNNSSFLQQQRPQQQQSHVDDNNNEADADDDPRYIVGWLPFTLGGKAPLYYGLPMTTTKTTTAAHHNNSDDPLLLLPKYSNRAVSHMAAALLAVDHFNTRNNVVVPQMAQLTTNCSYTIRDDDLIFVNTDGDPYVVSRYAMEQIAYQHKRLLAMVGPYTNEAALAAASLAAGFDIPLVAHGPDDLTLTRTLDNPRVLTTTANIHVLGATIVHFFLTAMQRSEALATLHVLRDIGDQYMQAVHNSAKDMVVAGKSIQQHLTYTIGPPFVGYMPGAGIGYALRDVHSKGVRNILVVLNDLPNQLPLVAEYAELHQVNTQDYTWMLATERSYDLEQLVFLAAQNSNITKLMRGMATIKVLDGFTANPSSDSFLMEWKQQNETFVQRLNQLHPMKRRPKQQQGYYKAPPDYFTRALPQPGAGFLYDAVMTVALGKCKQESKAKKEEAAAAAATQEGGGGGGGGVNGGMMNAAVSGGNANNNGGGGGVAADNNAARRRLGGSSSSSTTGRSSKIRGQTSNISDKGKSLSSHRRRRRLQDAKKMSMMRAGAPPNPLMEAMLDTNFDGATGRIAFRDHIRYSGNRKRETYTFGAYNFRDMEPHEIQQQQQKQLVNATTTDLPAYANYSLWYYLTHVKHPVAASSSATAGITTVDGQQQQQQLQLWEPTPHAPFIFANGLDVPPLLNRDLPKQNFLSAAVQIIGLALMSFAILTSLLAGGFVWTRKAKDRHLTQAQPPFLMMLIFGTIVFSASIFTMSFDESYPGWTVSNLSGMCMAMPWLLSLGYIIVYLALFSKLLRINKVMQFRRTKVEVRQVVLPLGLSMLACFAILMTWTVVDPYQWVREEIDTETKETYGKCQSDHALAFWILLFSLMALSTIACGCMAFRCRDIDRRYAESNLIFYTIFVQIQVLLVGIPVLVILGDDQSADATYLGRSLLIFVISMTTLTFMIGPKVKLTLDECRGGHLKERKTRSAGGGVVHISGSIVPGSSSMAAGKISELTVSQVSNNIPSRPGARSAGPRVSFAKTVSHGSQVSQSQRSMESRDHSHHSLEINDSLHWRDSSHRLFSSPPEDLTETAIESEANDSHVVPEAEPSHPELEEEGAAEADKPIAIEKATDSPPPTESDLQEIKEQKSQTFET